jgi:F-type H+-transporting ATPase subunit gamma
MAGGQERILRRRIKSVQSTKKITRAMELIAASRIVKAQARVHAAQPYADGITDVVRNLAAAGAGRDNPILQTRDDVKKIAYIAIAADRGLCGGYNSTVIRTTERAILAEKARGIDYGLVAVGRKPESYFRFREYRIDASLTGFSDTPTYENARQIGAAVIPPFLAGDYDRVELIYWQFNSAGSQELVRKRLLPLDTTGIDVVEPGTVSADYEFEPSPDAILDELLPRYVEARIFAALLNAAASEYAAKQRAMKAATDNADELIRNLSRVMNRARQDAITNEIMEIVGGAEALSSGAGLSEDVPNA